MRAQTIIAGILVVLGIVVLGLLGITYKTRGKPVDIGPLHVETTESHFIPPVVERSRCRRRIMLLVLDTRRA